MNTHFVTTRQGARIPRGIAQLAVGKDAYLRDSIVPCEICSKAYRLGDSDSPELCPACYDVAGEENARQDAIAAECNRPVPHGC